MFRQPRLRSLQDEEDAFLSQQWALEAKSEDVTIPTMAREEPAQVRSSKTKKRPRRSIVGLLTC